MGTSGGSRISQRGCQLSKEVCQPIILQNFCRNLHENERIWTERGARVPGAPLNQPLGAKHSGAYVSPSKDFSWLFKGKNWPHTINIWTLSEYFNKWSEKWTDDPEVAGRMFPYGTEFCDLSSEGKYTLDIDFPAPVTYYGRVYSKAYIVRYHLSCLTQFY